MKAPPAGFTGQDRLNLAALNSPAQRSQLGRFEMMQHQVRDQMSGGGLAGELQQVGLLPLSGAGPICGLWREIDRGLVGRRKGLDQPAGQAAIAGADFEVVWGGVRFQTAERFVKPAPVSHQLINPHQIPTACPCVGM